MTDVPAHLKGMTQAQITERLKWLQEHRHFPGAAADIASLHFELALRFTGHEFLEEATS